MSQRFTRRRFLQTSAAAAAFRLGGRLLGAEEKKASANERLHVGVIGVAGQGEYNWGQLKVAAAGAEIVALCDVDESRTGKARDTFPKATFYIDFRNLLDRKRGSTPSSSPRRTTRTPSPPWRR